MQRSIRICRYVQSAHLPYHRKLCSIPICLVQRNYTRNIQHILCKITVMVGKKACFFCLAPLRMHEIVSHDLHTPLHHFLSSFALHHFNISRGILMPTPTFPLTYVFIYFLCVLLSLFVLPCFFEACFFGACFC